jgi:hypothetical protein
VSDIVEVAVVAGVFGLLNIITTAVLSLILKEQLHEVHKELNSRLSQMLVLAKSEGKSLGILQEKDFQERHL